MEDPIKEIGKWLLIAGGIFMLIGLIFYAGGRWLPVGKLPGDIHIEGKNYSIYFPLATSIIISIILTIIVNIFIIKK